MAGQFVGLSRWRTLLPQGGSLPDSAWQARHTAILAVLWGHAVFIPIFALAREYSAGHAAVEGAVVPAFTALAMAPNLSRRARTMLASIGLLSASAVLVHLSGGVIEMHFHFFVMVALVTLYQDWLPFLAAISYVFIHHGLIGALDADSVFNHYAARNGPWKWAGIHALFISALSIVCLATWRLSELLQAERGRAEDRLREESRITETLHEVGAAVAAELDTQKVLQTVTDAATSVCGAAFGAFFYNVVDARGEAYLLYTLSGAPMEAFSHMGLPRNTPIFGPTFAGEAPVRLDDVTVDSRYGHMAPHYGLPKGHLPVRSYLAVPVRSRTGEVLGGLFFGHPEAGQFDEADERTVVGIAAHAAVALDNARLYESERVARTDAEAASARLAVLSDATKALTSSFELDVMLGELARLVTGSIARVCVIDLMEPDGSLRRAAAAGPPEWIASVSALRSWRSDDGHPALEALRSGRPQFCEQDGLRTAVVPLPGRQEPLGLLWLANDTSADPKADAATLLFAEELAARAAIGVENARLFARQRSVSETLQHSLLPERLPEIPGLATAARYVPGGPDVDVGGDWYDVMQLPGGSIGLAMGDVVGRGERAASLMGQLRNAVRAYAFGGKPPREVVECLNTLLLDAGGDHMATMIYAVLDTETGELRLVNAGHPPPLLVTTDGAARFLEGGHGTPVGALPTAGYVETCTVLAPGATLLLYTDGLVEDRDTALESGLARLRAAASAGPTDLEGFCSHVFRRALAGGPSHDDAALLAVQLLELEAHLSLRVPAQPGVLAPLRATLRRWLAQVGASEAEAYELLTACGEACTNAIRHASGPVQAEFEVEATARDGDIEILVRDHGCWRETRRDVGGRGLPIIEAYVDDLDIVRRPTGTEVRMRRRLAFQHEVVR